MPGRKAALECALAEHREHGCRRRDAFESLQPQRAQLEQRAHQVPG